MVLRMAPLKIRRTFGEMKRLVVVSNRVPAFPISGSDEEVRAHPTGGLVSALYPVMQQRGGLWFGWSGENTSRRENNPVRLRRLGSINLATIDLSEDAVDNFYAGFCNRVLWPLFHSLPSHLKLRRDEYRAYQQVNHYFASNLIPLLRKGDLVWIHDYHLIPLGAELRCLGWTDQLGFFLHTPFPPVDILTTHPWAGELLVHLLAYDLLGFHTQQYCRNFMEAVCREVGGNFDGNTFCGASSVRVGVYAIGIDPDAFERWASSLEAIRYGNRIRQIVRNRRIVLGVDRLDYTKGIPERLMAFEQLLERYPSWHGRVSMIQISAPSRSCVPEYSALKREVDEIVGRINGRFSEDDWIPVHYWYRSFSQDELSALYREADVCFVTPLRDGMNLVAKEYIASQTGEPGVLILSRFCGAAEDLREAIIINPYDIDGTAESLKHALDMPLGERQYRWQALLKRVHNHTAQSWCNQFLAELVGLPDMQQQKIWRSVRKHTDPFRGGIKGADNYPE